MKKVFNWISKNRSKIFVVLAIIVIAINVLPIDAINNAVYAEITRDKDGNTIENETSDAIGAVLRAIGNYSLGGLGTSLAVLINGFTLLIFLILYGLFGSIGVSAGFNFPFPDQLVFNRLAFFDPNFINPPTYSSTGALIKDSPVALMKGVITDMYYSFFILAGTIFVIAAMIIGIKLALSTLATQKAQYKTALTNWVMGVVLLFTVHFLMAGMFYINEQIVEAAYHVSEGLEFEVDMTDLFQKSITGKLISGFVDITRFATGNDNIGKVSFYGYSGYIWTVIIKAVLGDLTSSIVFAIILGQTVSLVVTYIKRLFFCIILGMMAPIIVAVDVIKKSMA